MKKDLLPKGKDNSYVETIEYFENIFKKSNFNIEIVSWENPVKGIWSVHVRDSDFPRFFTNGKGISKNGALASAYGEFLERLSTGFLFADYYFGLEVGSNVKWDFFPDEKWFMPDGNEIPKGVLSENLLKFYNPNGELGNSSLIDSNTPSLNKGICTIPFSSLKDNTTVNFPVSILNNLYVSNGMAAGNTMEEARVQALSEIIERFVKNQIISQGITLPDVPQSELIKYKKVVDGIQELEESGFRVLIKDASLGGKFPVVNITIINSNDSGTFAAFGAHPLFEIAVERTLTELLQGRSLDRLKDFPMPVFDDELVAGYGNLEEHFIDSNGLLNWSFFKQKPDYTYKEWSFEGSRNDELKFLEDIIEKDGFEIYLREFKWMGVDSCRIIIPGMSEIYPVEDLVENNKNDILWIRDFLLDIQSKTPEECSEFYEQFCESGYSLGEKIGELMGLPWFSSFVVVEVNILLSLYIQEYNDTVMWCENISNLDGIPKNLKIFYNAIGYLINSQIIESNDLKDSLFVANLFFQPSVVSDSMDLINRKTSPLSILHKKIENLLKNMEYTQFLQTLRKYRKQQS
jgi:ribosomal protein S12 methylthiotransferase accessory factor